ncbi:hypothetical protein [Kitasatospora indigofera]|uniref:hypothetical protein n=1 Tax=Kitasatospora indigofera TaxID=67307 RepID=UPI0036D04C4E
MPRPPRACGAPACLGDVLGAAWVLHTPRRLRPAAVLQRQAVIRGDGDGECVVLL